MMAIFKILWLNGIYNHDGSFKCDTSTGLLKGRRDAYEKSAAIVKALNRKGKLASAVVRKQIEKIRNEEVMQEFAGVVIFFLERKAKSLESQGK